MLNRAETVPQSGVDALLCFSIYAAGHAFNQFYRPRLDELGLTYPQFLVMMTLWQRDDLTVKDIGHAVQLESNTLTPLLKRLEALGFVTRTRDTDDERQVRISLTDAGRAAQGPAAAVSACLSDAVGLDSGAVERLRQMIDAVRDGLLAQSAREQGRATAGVNATDPAKAAWDDNR